MKVFHFLFTASCRSAAQSLAGQVAPGDVVVVALDNSVRQQVTRVIRKQFVEKADATPELAALADDFKLTALAADYAAYVDRAMDRMEIFLYEGMTLRMEGEDFRYYLTAMVVDLAARAIASLIPGSQVFDGRSLVMSSEGGIEQEATVARMKELPSDVVSVVTGGFGHGDAGETVALRRTGSEVTAAMIAAARGADQLVFLVWNYDPAGITSLSYEEAAQRFAVGRPVYPPALYPARQNSIPVVIQDAEGPVLMNISGEVAVRKDAIAGVICSDPMDLFTIVGTGLQGTVGVASSIFGALAARRVNIHFISQALSEYSITFAVAQSQTAAAEEALKEVIAAATSPDLYYSSCPVAILSVYGGQMLNRPGVSGKVYGALGAAGINVLASSQGGEQLSISIVVASADAAAAEAALSALV